MQPSTVMSIGPEEAMRLFENNKNNRAISDKIVKQYAADMRAGNWKETGDPIYIDINGNLLNGQHRLWAIIESGVTLRFHVIYETDDDAFATFDTGRVRDLSQLVGISNPDHPDKACAAGAARLVWTNVADQWSQIFGVQVTDADCELMVKLANRHVG